MQLTLSTAPADPRWGEKALLSADEHGMTVHLTGDDALSAIQRAGRKIDGQGIKQVALVGALMRSADEENEPFWRLPLAEFHLHHLPSNFADMSNVAGGAHSAGASTAAAFISHFVENYRQGWLHIDCSATYRKGAVEQWSAGATGLGVRTLANLLLAQAQD
ncbi:hypothetical protein [Sodalis praecaptivus]|uniref:hypothetical protein n=1 Tax=Sodalis praecaptivus TaxID=1239307 RepID=UPI00280BECED|nr:hypothetical protein [Sodalis praecaptivus]